jgi:CubicO group peptidase (beta-lactamase class C family)
MQYSNIHYWVIGRIVEHLSKTSYVDYVQAHILDALGMSNSYYNHKVAEETGHRAEPFVRADKNPKKCKESSDKEMDMSCYGRPFATSWFAKGDGLFIAPVGGLVSSTEDIVCFPTLTTQWLTCSWCG